MNATLTRGVPFADYLALAGEHFSSLKWLDMSPLHYRHALAHPVGESGAMTLGRLTHAIVLTPELPVDVAIYEGTRRGRRWETFQAEHAGQTILRAGDPALVTALAMRAAVQRHPEASRLLRAGEGEVTLRWEAEGSACRGRLDWLRPCGSIVELKTTRSIATRLFMREVAQRLYHVQLAFYTDGLTAVLGHAPPELPAMVAVENAPPYDVCVYRVGFDALEAGQRKVDAWLRTLAECRASGRWPGVGGDGVMDMRLPDWALGGDEDVDLSGIGG